MQFAVSFDFVITLKDKSYKASISLDLPCGNLIEEGTSSKEIRDMSHLVFKRVNLQKIKITIAKTKNSVYNKNGMRKM